MDMLSKAIEMNGTKAIITNTNASVVIKPIKDSYKDGVNFNYLFTYSPIKNGNIVNIDNVNYIVLEKEENLVNTYNKATITKAQIVIYKEQKIFGYIRALKDVVDNNRYFNVLADELELTIPYMELISVGDTVSYNKKNFNVQSIDDTKEGLLVLILKYSTTVGSEGYNNQQKPIVVPVEEKPIEPNTHKKEKPSSTTTEEHKEDKPKEVPKEHEKVEEPQLKPTESEKSKEEKEDFSGTFKIDGEQKVQRGKISTYTLSPARKTVKWFIDDKSKASVEIISQDNGSITLKNIGVKMNVIKLVAKSPDDRELCNKGLFLY
ncbi:hypothetical protein G6Z12_07090 [Clostridium perfringens]|uniref:hypothetical protein n=1 Tax=Clostridium perfringens TaxID=1502 RepID=UPI0013E3A0A5|nr:hypothetical protein [Clostridium perfringens]NGT51707.1 hypothetical protein [Clostridium perfringens]NGU21999.1 hypothetical protein [Clostridium perfringens]